MRPKVTSPCPIFSLTATGLLSSVSRCKEGCLGVSIPSGFLRTGFLGVFSSEVMNAKVTRNSPESEAEGKPAQRVGNCVERERASQKTRTAGRHPEGEDQRSSDVHKCYPASNSRTVAPQPQSRVCNQFKMSTRQECKVNRFVWGEKGQRQWSWRKNEKEEASWCTVSSISYERRDNV